MRSLQYMHADKKSRMECIKYQDHRFEFFRLCSNEHIIIHGERPVLVVQTSTTMGDIKKRSEYVLVPGYLLSQENNSSKIEPIVREEDKKSIVDKINGKFRGPINFWG